MPAMICREANIFVADFLMDENAVLDMLNDDISFFEAAAQFYVLAELLDFKFWLMKCRGFEMIEPPLMGSSNFPKNIWHL